MLKRRAASRRALLPTKRFIIFKYFGSVGREGAVRALGGAQLVGAHHERVGRRTSRLVSASWPMQLSRKTAAWPRAEWTQYHVNNKASKSDQFSWPARAELVAGASSVAQACANQWAARTWRCDANSFNMMTPTRAPLIMAFNMFFLSSFISLAARPRVGLQLIWNGAARCTWWAARLACVVMRWPASI